MKTKWALLAVIAVCFTLAQVCYASVPERTPPGSFLRYRATTIKQLVKYVSSSTAVSSLYARHYKIAPQEVARRFSTSLKLISLKRAVRVKSYYTGTSGTIYSKTKLLPRGSLVFADERGKPVLAWSCGNPLTEVLPAKKESKTAAVNRPWPGARKVAPVVTAEIPTAPVEFVAPPVEVPTIEAVAPVKLPLAAAAGAVSMPSVAETLTGLSALSKLVPLAGVIAVSASRGHAPPPIPVPEPSGIMCLATGLLIPGILGFRRRH